MIITANIKSRKRKKKTNNKQQQEALKGKENNASYCFEEGSCVFFGSDAHCFNEAYTPLPPPTPTLTRPVEATDTHGNKRLRLGFEHQTCYGL